MRRLLLALGGGCATALWLASLPVAAQTFSVPALPDPSLAQQTGKFLLPNGVDVALTVQSTTLVDGHEVLTTVFTADKGEPTLHVYAPAAGQQGPNGTAAAPATTAGGLQPGINVVIDRSGGVTTIRPTWGSAGIPVAVTSGTQATAGSTLPEVHVVPGGAAQQTGGGAVSIQQLAHGDRIELAGGGLDISHLVGQSFGTVVTNTANDRSIDTMTSVDISLHNATPDVVGSSLMRAEDAALEAARDLVR